MTKHSPSVNYNELAHAAKSDPSAFEQLFVALYAERKRFIHYSRLRFGDIDAETIFNDSVQSCIVSYDPTRSFIGLLRLRLNSTSVTMYKREAARRARELKHVQQYADITVNPILFASNAVEFSVFCGTLDERLQKAVQLLIDGFTLNEVRKQLGYGDMRTLRNELRRCFSLFIQ